MNSFISWIGGKKLLRNKIVEQFPESGSYERYIEVFGGAGWVLFSKEKHAKMEVLNDINGELINLYRCVKYHPEALQKELEFTLMSREQFFDCKEQSGIRGMTDIQRAARFYVLVKESFGTDMKSFGVKGKNMSKSIEYLGEVSERLKRVVIENESYEQLIRTYDRKSALFYLDPPYFEAEKYYSNRFDLSDHKKLNLLLGNIKGKFILSYNDCEFIRNLYSDYNILEIERNDNLLTKNNPRKYREILIKNY